jgi:type II secretory pathway pseudopilin PulG
MTFDTAVGGAMRPSRSRQDGFTLVEIAFTMTLLVIGMLGFSRALLASSRAEQKTQDADRATQAARRILESIQAEAFPDAFRRYNATSADDPGGAGTAPGSNFAVTGLSAREDDPDGFVGEVVFPSPDWAPLELREDFDAPELGMPRDLNGDGGTDALNHALDYRILPVQVRVRWRSSAGPGLIVLNTMLANY